MDQEYKLLKDVYTYSLIYSDYHNLDKKEVLSFSMNLLYNYYPSIKNLFIKKDKKTKLIELKLHLKYRNLKTNGNKDILIKRLNEHTEQILKEFN